MIESKLTLYELLNHEDENIAKKYINIFLTNNLYSFKNITLDKNKHLVLDLLMNGIEVKNPHFRLNSIFFDFIMKSKQLFSQDYHKLTVVPYKSTEEKISSFAIDNSFEYFLENFYEDKYNLKNRTSIFIMNSKKTDEIIKAFDYIFCRTNSKKDLINFLSSINSTNLNSIKDYNIITSFLNNRMKKQNSIFQEKEFYTPQIKYLLLKKDFIEDKKERNKYLYEMEDFEIILKIISKNKNLYEEFFENIESKSDNHFPSINWDLLNSEYITKEKFDLLCNEYDKRDILTNRIGRINSEIEKHPFVLKPLEINNNLFFKQEINKEYLNKYLNSIDIKSMDKTKFNATELDYIYYNIHADDINALGLTYSRNTMVSKNNSSENLFQCFKKYGEEVLPGIIVHDNISYEHLIEILNTLKNNSSSEDYILFLLNELKKENTKQYIKFNTSYNFVYNHNIINLPNLVDKFINKENILLYEKNSDKEVFIRSLDNIKDESLLFYLENNSTYEEVKGKIKMNKKDFYIEDLEF